MWRKVYESMMLFLLSLPGVRSWNSRRFWKRVIRNEEELDRILTLRR